ncbi:MAG: hypothetical protein K2M41_03245 [Muribaculaceae bacterium]|nr:hypothetical protein [Muribaculaceae bacterium]
MVNIYNNGVSNSRTLAEMNSPISNIEDDNFMCNVIEEIKVKLSHDLKEIDNIEWSKDDNDDD